MRIRQDLAISSSLLAEVFDADTDSGSGIRKSCADKILAFDGKLDSVKNR